ERMGPPLAAEHLLPLLGIRWPHIRSAAARAIGHLGFTPAVPGLLAALRAKLERTARTVAEDNEARTYIRVLAALDAHDAVQVLIGIAQNCVGLRSTAVQALTQLDPLAAAPRLVPMLADPGERLRLALLKLMIKADHCPALPAIRTLLEDRRVEIRSAALRA